MVVLRKPRDIPVEGRELEGVHFAMDFLPQQNKRNEGDTITDEVSITAKDKNVLIIGGGDTGSDCLGTSLRQGAKNVYQFELLSEPPRESEMIVTLGRNGQKCFRVSSSHEEANERAGQRQDHRILRIH